MGEIYDIEFTLNEKIMLSNCSYRKGIIRSLMSVYSYIIKNSKETTFDISFAEFLNKYNRYHDKLTLTTLKSRIAKLIQVGLVSATKVNKLGYTINSYIANRLDSNSKNFNEEPTAFHTTFPTDSKLAQDVEITKSDEHQILLNTKSERMTKDLDCNTVQYKKNDSVEKAVTLAKELLNKFKVRNKFIKERVLVKVKKYALRMGADEMSMNSYISKIIEENVNKNRFNYQGYKQNSGTKFNNFDNREYEWNELEAGLVFGKDVSLEKCTKKSSSRDTYTQNSGTKFNNFNAREYDYNSLEKQLLGWD